MDEAAYFYSAANNQFVLRNKKGIPEVLLTNKTTARNITLWPNSTADTTLYPAYQPAEFSLPKAIINDYIPVVEQHASWIPTWKADAFRNFTDKPVVLSGFVDVNTSTWFQDEWVLTIDTEHLLKGAAIIALSKIPTNRYVKKALFMITGNLLSNVKTYSMDIRIQTVIGGTVASADDTWGYAVSIAITSHRSHASYVPVMPNIHAARVEPEEHRESSDGEWEAL